MKPKILLSTLILSALFSGCSESDESIPTEDTSVKIHFERTVTSEFNPDVNGIDSMVVLIDNNRVWESNFYDSEFHITDTKKGIKNHYYNDWFDNKCFYDIGDTTNYQVDSSKESKTILGFKCEKRTFSSARDTITAYFTTDLDASFSYLPNLYIDGCILEFSIKDNWSIESWKAVIIDPESKETIEIPADYIDDESSAYKDKIANKRSELSFSTTPFQAGDTAPLFSAKSLSHGNLDLEKLKGKVVVLNFWYIACTGCVAEMPDLNKLTEQFEGQDVEFISITNNSRNDLYKFLRRKKFNFKILPNSGIIASQYAVTGDPTTIIIDKTGEIAQAYYFQMIEPHIGYDNLVDALNVELNK